MMTRSAGRLTAELRGGGTGGQSGSGGRGGRGDRGLRNVNEEIIKEMDGQGNDQGMKTNRVVMELMGM
ncbi:hypothetical protein Tco_1373836 [Tanacetum coccineum]